MTLRYDAVQKSKSYIKTDSNWLVLDQDVHFFYTRSHLIAPQSCVLMLSTNFSLFSHWNSELRNLVIEWCKALKTLYF